MKRRGRRTQIDGQFAPRTIEMLRSPAMAALSLSGRRVLDRLEIELGDHGGNENGRLPCTFDDFQRFGIDRHAIAPALRECIALGFVECTEKGVAGNAEFRRPSMFRLTYRASDYSEPTNEWKRLKTHADAIAAARVARQQKQKSSGGKNHVSVWKPHTESRESPVGETPTTVPVWGTPTTLDISGRGIGDVAQAVVVHLAASRSRSAPPKGRRSERAATRDTIPPSDTLAPRRPAS